jgi:hypothetical protein
MSVEQGIMLRRHGSGGDVERLRVVSISICNYVISCGPQNLC